MAAPPDRNVTVASLVGRGWRDPGIIAAARKRPALFHHSQIR